MIDTSLKPKLARMPRIYEAYFPNAFSTGARVTLNMDAPPNDPPRKVTLTGDEARRFLVGRMCMALSNRMEVLS